MIKKSGIFFLAIWLIACLTGCKVEPDEVFLTKIEVTSNPDKTEYFIGEELDLTGLKVTASYSDGTKADVTKDAKTAGFDSSVVKNKQKITVTYEEKSATFLVKIKVNAVEKLVITEQPVKTEYFVGDYLDLTGLEVTAIYSNGDEIDVTQLISTSYFDSSSPMNSMPITVKYSGKITSFTVKIKAIEIEEIAITAQPVKTEYSVGDLIDLTGLEVTATYNNGTTQNVTSSVTTSGFNSSAAADSQTVTVTYGEKTATFTVKIKANNTIAIVLSSEPTKKEYYEGDYLDLTGIKVTAILNDGTTEDVTEKITTSGFDSTVATDSQTVTVTYQTKTASFNVKIMKVLLTGIEITSEPAKKEYFIGEELDLTGLEVKTVYNNGSKTNLSTMWINTSGFDSSKSIDSQTVTVSYLSYKASFTVKIKPLEVTSILIISEPAKKEYLVGEELDLTGLKVTGILKNENIADVTAEVTTSGFNSSTPADSQTITVTYNGKTTTFTVKIKAIEITAIVITSEPSKKEYFIGEEIDLAGLKVTAVYNNGNKTDITADITTSGFDSNTAADSQAVTVSYNGKSTSFTVKVRGFEEMTVHEFIASLGTAVETITYDTTKVPGVTLSTDGKTANVYGVKISGVFDYEAGDIFPNTLVTADLRGLNTSGVTSMSAMFGECSSLTSLDLSSFDTSKVTEMYAMFGYCTSLTTIDLSSFDTSSVTDIAGMFVYCSSLTNIDLSSFNTSSVTDMNSMFGECSSLTSLDLSMINTSKVTDMSYMFYDCKSLSDVNLSSFDTSKVTSEENIFYACGTADKPLTVTVDKGWSLALGTTLFGAVNLKFKGAIIPEIGKIVMSNGSYVEAEKYSSYTGTAIPVGIVCHVNDDIKTGLMVGLENTEKLCWAKYGTTGYNTNFTAIQGTEDGGDIDGSDNWAEICKADPTGTLDPATNYPAFNYALNYAQKANITGTKYAGGWYIPTAYELYNYLYKNGNTLRTSLTAAGRTGLDYYYLSSSQSETNNDFIEIHLKREHVSEESKSYSYNYICCLRAF